MKQSSNCFYLYAHRKDNGDVFYIGKGKRRRAWEFSSRNEKWKKIAKKYGVNVQIWFDNLSENEAFRLEVEAITRYGRDNLCNLTDGGEGPSGVVHAGTLVIKNAIIEYAENNEKPPRFKSKLGRRYNSYMRCERSDSYDPVFEEKIYAIRPEWRKKRKVVGSVQRKIDIKEFIETYKRLPCGTSEDLHEMELGRFCAQVKFKSSNMYDKEFCEYLKGFENIKDFRCNRRKDAVKRFCNQFGRSPKRKSKDAEESVLGHDMANYCKVTNNCYDFEFRQWMIDGGFLKPKQK